MSLNNQIKSCSSELFYALVIDQKQEAKKTHGVLPREKCEVNLPEHPLDVSRMTGAQLDEELEKGYADAEAGRTVPMDQAFANVRKEFGV